MVAAATADLRPSTTDKFYAVAALVSPPHSTYAKPLPNAHNTTTGVYITRFDWSTILTGFSHTLPGRFSAASYRARSAATGWEGSPEAMVSEKHNLIIEVIAADGWSEQQVDVSARQLSEDVRALRL